MKKWISVSNRLRSILRKWGSDEASNVKDEPLNFSTQRVNLTRVSDSALVQPTFFPDGLSLKGYQLVGVAYLGLLHGLKMNAILADEMVHSNLVVSQENVVLRCICHVLQGLGKTVQSIVHLANVKANEPKLPHLIVVPASTLENWSRELAVSDLEICRFFFLHFKRFWCRCGHLFCALKFCMDQKKSEIFSFKS